MKWRFLAASLLAAGLSSVASAQPADLPIPAAASDTFPAGISVVKTKTGSVYVDAQGHTLYGLDLRAIVDRTANGAKYCQGPCLEQWEPVLAPADAKADASIGSNPLQNLNALAAAQGGQGQGGQAAQARPQGQGGQAPGAQGQGGQRQGQGDGGINIIGGSAGASGPVSDWSVVEGPKGPQYVYKRWHLVYTHKGDKPGQTDHDGYDKMVWNTLKFVPPAPKVSGPTMVTTSLVDGAYVLADKSGHALFTGKCGVGCRWVPLQAGAAGYGLGEWSVDRSGDTPQWIYRGKPVFVSQEDDPMKAPQAGILLRP